MATAVLRLALASALVGVGMAAVDRWLLGGWAYRPPRKRRRVSPPAPPQRRPLEVVAADLRRLTHEFALVPSGATLVRWRALWSAYDSVLAEAADLLEVPHILALTAVGVPRDIERLRVLAALENAGLAVRG